MNSNEQIRNGANRYGVTLCEDIKRAYPQVKCIYGGGNIYLHLPDSLGYRACNKMWLYKMLEALPEIDAPLQRLQVIIYLNESIQCVTIINPSKFDVAAMDEGIEEELKFSSPQASKEELEPLPLDHPWYSDKDYFRKQPTKKKNIEFDDIKDLPNVKPIVDDIKKRSIKI